MTDEALRAAVVAETYEEYQVVHMDGPRFDRTSSVYRADPWMGGRDGCLDLVRGIVHARGGAIVRRVVTETPWEYVE